MRKSIKFLILAAMITLTLPLLSPGSGKVMAAELKHSTTEADRRSVTLTIYSSGPALIADTRDIKVASPRGALTMLDVPKTIRPETLQVVARDKRGGAIDGLKVLEANFTYDLASNSKILKKFIGEEVTLVEDNDFQDRTKTTKARLLRFDGGPVFLIDGEVHIGHPGRIVLPETKGLTLAPALSVRYSSPRPTAVDLTAVYQAMSIDWSADYSLTLSNSGTSAKLSSWITVGNNSGTDFRGAGITVVAGDINRAPEANYPRMKRSMVMMEASSEPVTKGVFEYYQIKVPGKKTILDGESRHFAYMASTITGVKKEYTIRDRADYSGQADGKTKLPVEVSVKFKNSKENNAGVALPAGIMRIYHKKGKEAPFFIGEERIGNTPEGEAVKVKAGSAFDITATRTVTDFKRIRTRLHEEAVSVAIKNSKKEPVTVTVKSSLSGRWEILASSEPYKKLDAYTIGFDLTLPPGGETELSYRYRTEQ